MSKPTVDDIKTIFLDVQQRMISLDNKLKPNTVKILTEYFQLVYEFHKEHGYEEVQH